MTFFGEFAKVCSRIEGISGSLEMTSVVAEFLKEVSDGELEIATRFIMGHVFPVWSKEELGIGPSMLYSAISKTSLLPVKRIEELVKETGDVGLAAEKALASGRTRLSFFSQEELTIKDIYMRFQTIAKTAGKGSQGAKIKNLQYLFGAVKPLESAYIARLSIEEMRIGVGGRESLEMQYLRLLKYLRNWLSAGICLPATLDLLHILQKKKASRDFLGSAW